MTTTTTAATFDIKNISVIELGQHGARAMAAKADADAALQSIQEKQKESAAILAAVVRETRARKIALPARVNANSKGEGAELIRAFRSTLEEMGLAKGTVNNYLTGFREAVAGKRAAESVKENKARDKAPAAKKGADAKGTKTKALISIGSDTTADEFAVILLGVLKSKKGVDWSFIHDAVKDALAAITES